MSTILTLFTFPWLAMALWRKHDLNENQESYPNFKTTPKKPIAFVMNSEPKPACEILLPTLWHVLSPHHTTIGCVATLNEPGPFTATRAGLSFVKGLSDGDPAWTFFSTSFFDLLSQDQSEMTFLDTGGQHWINANGIVSSEITPPYHGISANTCTESLILTWSERLAMLANDFEQKKLDRKS